MVDTMMEGWRRRQGGAPALAPLPMDADPRLAPPPAEAAR
jgi:hypothetical protein